MSDTIGLILLSLWCLVGIFMTALRLPGTWWILAGGIGYKLLAPENEPGWGVVTVLAGLAAAGELFELICSAATTRKGGGSPRAAWGGLIGGFVGMVTFGALFSLPVPVIGTAFGAAVGALAGCFLGAAVVEIGLGRSLQHGTRVGLFAALGFALGGAVKTATALTMAILAVGSIVLR